MTEAVCDGQSAYVLMTYISDDVALVMGGEAGKEALPYQREREAYKRVIEVGSVLRSVETNGVTHEIWDNWQWEYLSAQSFTMDISIILSNISVGDELIMHMTVWYMEDGKEEKELPFDIVISTQQANTETYGAVNLPVKLENYVVKAATVTRTDMACYVTLEVEDAYMIKRSTTLPSSKRRTAKSVRSPCRSTVPIGSMCWGKTAILCPLQQGNWYSLEFDNEEWEHMLVSKTVPPLKSEAR